MDKKKIFDSLVKMLSKNKVMSGVHTEENNASYIASFFVYGSITCTFNMRKEGDICIMKAECVPRADDEADPSVIANDIIQDYDNVRFTVYDGKIVFQKVIPFTADDSNIEETLRESLKSFFNLFIDNAELLECNFKEDTKDEAKQGDDTGSGGISGEENSGVNYENYDENEEEREEPEDIAAEDDEVVDNSEYPSADNELADTNKGHSRNDDDLDAMLDALQAMESPVKSIQSTTTQGSEGTQPKGKKDKAPEESKKPQTTEAGRVAPTAQSCNSMSIPEDSPEKDAFAEQLNNMYKEFDGIFKDRELALDARESKLNKYADGLKTKEQQIEDTRRELEEKRKRVHSEVEAEFNSAWEALEHEKKELAVAAGKLDIDRRKVEIEQATIKTKRKALDEDIALHAKAGVISDDSEYKQEIQELQEQVSALKTGERQLRDKITEQDHTISKQNAIINKFKAIRAEWEQEKNDLLAQIEEIQSEPVPEVVREDSITIAEHNAELKSRDNHIKELENRINTLSVEVDKLNSEKEHLETEKVELTTQMEAMKAELASAKNSSDVQSKNEPEDFTAAAKDIIDTTKALGITLDIVPGNAEMVLAGEQGGCTICVNVGAGMAYVEKPVKKSLQHLDTVDKWNGEDIRYAYFLSKDKVVCKCKYDNAAKAINEVLTKINTL